MTRVPSLVFYTMKNRKLFTKIVFIGLIVLLVVSLLAPAIFSQVPDLRKPRQETLLNGLKLLMWSDRSAPKVVMKVRIHSGSAFDPQGREGVMKMLMDNIFPNAETREFFAEDLGGSLDIVSNYDYIQISATATPDQFLNMVETVATALSNPTIDKEATAKLRTALLAKVSELEKDPAYVADQAAAKRLFGTFPYGRPEHGTAASVQKIDFADLLDAKQRFLTADNATVAVSGNFDPAFAYRAIRRTFGGWQKSDKRVPSTFAQPAPPETVLQMLESPAADKFEIRYIARGYSRNDKDFPASIVLARILEERIKAKTPAGYRPGVRVRSEGHILPGAIVFGMSGAETAANEPKIDANDLVLQAISTKITDAEFNAAKGAFAAEWNGRDMAERWFDIDTFKTVPVNAEQQTVTSLSLADVQRAADALAKQPVATVVLTKAKEGN